MQLGRWSVDHLFLDQDAVPTLVEVKRSSDTRIRREVVGQMLDYAANGVVYWPLEQLRELFVRQCERDGRDPERGRRRRSLGDEVDVEAWWQRAGDNLRAGQGADGVRQRRDPARAAAGRRVPQRPDEPRRGDRDRGQAVPLRRRHADARAASDRPDRRGRSAERSPRPRERRRWDEQSLFAELVEKRGERRDPRCTRALTTGRPLAGGDRAFGSGKVDGSWVPVVEAHGREHYPIALYSTAGSRSSSSICATAHRSMISRFGSSCSSRRTRSPVSHFDVDKISKRPRDPSQPARSRARRTGAAEAALEWVEQRAGTAD